MDVQTFTPQQIQTALNTYAKKKVVMREYQRTRYANDTEYRERQKAYVRAWAAKKKSQQFQQQKKIEIEKENI